MIEKIKDGIAVAKADAAMQTGDYSKACALYEKLISNNRKNINISSVLYSIAYCYYKSDEVDKCLRFLKRCLTELNEVDTTKEPFNETFKEAQKLYELIK